MAFADLLGEASEVRAERCQENVCCQCFRCNSETCESVRCVIANTRQGCIERCPNADSIQGVSARRTTFACRPNGRCKVVCGRRERADVQTTVMHRRGSQQVPVH